MTPNEIKAEARHRTAMFVLSALYGQEIEVKKIDADKKYAIKHNIGGETIWTEVTITAKKSGYDPDEAAKK
jgi:hypothetical protein